MTHDEQNRSAAAATVERLLVRATAAIEVLRTIDRVRGGIA